MFPPPPVPPPGVTVTATDRLLLPPGPVQASVKVVVSLIGPTLSLPEVGLFPDQPPEALQLSAWVVVQLRSELWLG